jgi:hypothetical protein
VESERTYGAGLLPCGGFGRLGFVTERDVCDAVAHLSQVDPDQLKEAGITIREFAHTPLCEAGRTDWTRIDSETNTHWIPWQPARANNNDEDRVGYFDDEPIGFINMDTAGVLDSPGHADEGDPDDDDEEMEPLLGEEAAEDVGASGAGPIAPGQYDAESYDELCNRLGLVEADGVLYLWDEVGDDHVPLGNIEVFAASAHGRRAPFKAHCRCHSRCSLWLPVGNGPEGGEDYMHRLEALLSWLKTGASTSKDNHQADARTIKERFGVRSRT